jgi:hypothetical protein
MIFPMLTDENFMNLNTFMKTLVVVSASLAMEGVASSAHHLAPDTYSQAIKCFRATGVNQVADDFATLITVPVEGGFYVFDSSAPKFCKLPTPTVNPSSHYPYDIHYHLGADMPVDVVSDQISATAKHITGITFHGDYLKETTLDCPPVAESDYANMQPVLVTALRKAIGFSRATIPQFDPAKNMLTYCKPIPGLEDLFGGKIKNPDAGSNFPKKSAPASRVGSAQDGIEIN